ncbi:MAG: 3-phosphoglycerate dehydrogenase [Clostridiales bacterium]|nr:3-phosphoglycerate dehydrogenase [Clostridiales bacterium]
MKKITVFNKIAQVGLDVLEKRYELVDTLDGADGILLRSAKLHDTVFPSSVKAIARSGAGVNNIPIERCTEQGIVVFNTPGANANGVKELTICALILASRDVLGGANWASSLVGEADVAKAVEAGKGAFVGCELAGKTLGVVGLGAIGGSVANAATALGMNVIGYDPYITAKAAWSLAPSVKQASGYDEIFKKSDYITLHVPATEQTKNMISEKTISQMKKGVKILNLSRAELVCADDIKAALASGKVGKYVTDFPTNETVGVEGIITIPHLGASTYESEDHCAVMAAKQLHEYLSCGNIANSVNFPSVSLPHTSFARACVLHKNVPNMLTQITSAFSADGINIDNLANGSKGQMAYTIVEISSAPDEKIVKELESIDGVIRVLTY